MQRPLKNLQKKNRKETEVCMQQPREKIRKKIQQMIFSENSKKFSMQNPLKKIKQKILQIEIEKKQNVHMQHPRNKLGNKSNRFRCQYLACSAPICLHILAEPNVESGEMVKIMEN